MHDLHIGDFYSDAARILTTLYMRFPVKTTLYIEDIIGPDTPDEFGLHSPRHLACFSAAIWLAEEGFFRFSQTIQQIALEDAVLTQNSFLFFTAMDNDEGMTRIKKISELVKNHSSEQLNAYVRDAFSKCAQQKNGA